MHAVSVIVGPTRAHWAQNDGTRAARAARGAALRGRPSHVAAAAVRRRAFQMCVHAATFNAGHASAMTGGLHGTVDPRSCQNVDAPIQAGTGEPHGPASWRSARLCMGSSIGTRTTALATIGRLPAFNSCCGHVTGPAPQGRPPWLHAQRACRHFEPSEPLWGQLLQKPRATEHAL